MEVLKSKVIQSRNVIETCRCIISTNISAFNLYRINAHYKQLQNQNVKVSINLRGREWVNQKESVYFNTIQGWRIEKVESVNTNDLPAAEAVLKVLRLQ
jgi:hypothetical protein